MRFVGFCGMLLVATLFSSQPLLAKPVQKEGLSCEVPDTWVADKPEPDRTILRDPDTKAVLTILPLLSQRAMDAAEIDQTLQDVVAANIDAMTKQGYKLGKPKSYARDDLQLIEITATQVDAKGAGVILKRYITVTADCVYILSFEYPVADEKTFKDATTLKILETLKVGPRPVSK